MHTIVYFSPTGNSKHLTKILARELSIHDEELLPLEFTNPKELVSDEHLVLIYPIHGFNAPRTVKRFVKNIPNDTFKKVSLIAVGCNDLWVNHAVSLDLRKQFDKKEIEIIVDEIIPMPLTFVVDFPMETKIKLIHEGEQKINKLSNLINENVVSKNKVKLKSKAINLIGKLENPAARLFGLELHAKKGCISCGICWNNCPENNIKENKKRLPKFGFNCSMCMRCMYICPEKVITPYISKFLVLKNGYNIDNISHAKQ